MPSGYTSDIYDDKGITFPEFAMQCARAFGALIDLRDEPVNATIPDKFEVSPHYSDRLEQASAEFERLTSMTRREATEEANRKADEMLAHRTEQDAKRAGLRKRYLDMLAKVTSWNPPTKDHENLKQFMIDQLKQSIDFDCSTFTLPEPPRDGEVWRQQEIERVLRDIEYYAEQNAKDIARAAEKTAWVNALRNSLKDST